MKMKERGKPLESRERSRISPPEGALSIPALVVIFFLDPISSNTACTCSMLTSAMLDEWNDTNDTLGLLLLVSNLTNKTYQPPNITVC